jgi:hypothetical protein
VPPLFHRAIFSSCCKQRSILRSAQDKTRLVLDPESDKVHCEAFALKVFGNADRIDRQGKADANTAKAYYAASFFFEVCTCLLWDAAKAYKASFSIKRVCVCMFACICVSVIEDLRVKTAACGCV